MRKKTKTVLIVGVILAILVGIDAYPYLKPMVLEPFRPPMPSTDEPRDVQIEKGIARGSLTPINHLYQYRRENYLSFRPVRRKHGNTVFNIPRIYTLDQYVTGPGLPIAVHYPSMEPPALLIANGTAEFERPPQLVDSQPTLRSSIKNDFVFVLRGPPNNHRASAMANISRVWGSNSDKAIEEYPLFIISPTRRDKITEYGRLLITDNDSFSFSCWVNTNKTEEDGQIYWCPNARFFHKKFRTLSFLVSNGVFINDAIENGPEVFEDFSNLVTSWIQQ